jgi:L-amino acid N-acyltransferase YncA
MSEGAIPIREATPADAFAIARVHVDSWRTTNPGIVSDEFLAGLTYEERGVIWTGILGSAEGQTHVFVADDRSDGVVGFASGGPYRGKDDNYDGELYAIYLLEAHQHRGTGRLLTSALASRLLEAGKHSLLAWVLMESTARRIYESLRSVVVMEQDITISGATLKEVGYVWEDINTLINN